MFSVPEGRAANKPLEIVTARKRPRLTHGGNGGVQCGCNFWAVESPNPQGISVFFAFSHRGTKTQREQQNCSCIKSRFSRKYVMEVPTHFSRIYQRLALLLFGSPLLLAVGCSTYEPFAPAREFSWRLSASQSNNPIFVENYNHEFLWSIVVDVVDNHFEIDREIPIRLYGNVLTEGHLETHPQIGASLAEPWHADSVGFSERFDCTLQTIRRRAEVHVVPASGGYTVEVKVFKELEDNPRPLRAVAHASNLRFRDSVDEFADKVDVDPNSAGWFIIERDTALENLLLLEIVYRLKNPPAIVRPAKEPIRG